MRLAILTAAIFLGVVTTARATVTVAIDLTHQRMHVTSSGGSYDWPISSARSGFSTPGGSYAPTRLERMHYSKKYHMSPMPYSIFFRGGFAIHGTYATGALGRPASHGCVRLAPGAAAQLYAMVQREGARISISGAPPASRPFAVARRRPVARSQSVAALESPRPRRARIRAYARAPYPAYYGFYDPQPYALPDFPY